MKYKIELWEGDKLKYSGEIEGEKYSKRKLRNIFKITLSALIGLVHINNKP